MSIHDFLTGINFKDLTDFLRYGIDVFFLYSIRMMTLHDKSQSYLKEKHSELEEDYKILEKQNKLIEDQYDSLLIRYKELEGRYKESIGETYGGNHVTHQTLQG